MTFLAYDIVERKSLEWKILKMVSVFVRHRDLADRETDGAVHWRSLCSKLRREFESEGARTFSDSQWLDYIRRGSNKPDLNIAQTRTTTSCVFAPSKGTQEEG